MLEKLFSEGSMTSQGLQQSLSGNHKRDCDYGKRKKVVGEEFQEVKELLSPHQRSQEFIEATTKKLTGWSDGDEKASEPMDEEEEEDVEEAEPEKDLH